jgi:tetratricopeptide (TPR) repeat protein
LDVWDTVSAVVQGYGKILIDQIVEMGNAIWAWFGNDDNRSRAVAIATVVGVLVTLIATIVGVLVFFVRALKPKRQTPRDVSTPRRPTGDVLSMDLHLKLLEKREAQLKEQLAAAHEEEKTQLTAQIAELQRQIFNPDASLEEARKRIADLEALLDREANHIGGDRIAEAKAALEEGDYSLADDIFAEIESRNELAVQETARAAYGRGEVAEAEVRWQDAARRYADAARLTPGFDTLFKAREYAWRAGHLDAAHRCGTDLVAFARKEGTQEQIATALNEHAITLQAQGRVAEAEALYREALEIDRKTIGEAHPGYAIDLNNLAGVVQAQGRYAEAEGLYREALEIDRKTIGEAHPDYAIRLNNLAGVVEEQGRYAEAETLYREALEIGRKTIGEAHPDYGTRLNNLAGVVKVRGRYAEAEGLYREALEIGRKTIGEAHPDYAIRLNNLAGVVASQEQFAEAEALYWQALEITRDALGEVHPSYAIRLVNLGSLLVKSDRVEEGREMLERALAIFRAALPPDHPHIASTQHYLDALTAP